MLPEAYSTYNAFYEIGERTEMQILEIINEVSQDANAPQGSVAQKIRDFYNAGMDTVAIDERGYSELLPYFERIDALGNKAELAALTGYLHSEGFGGFFEIGVGINAKNAEQNIMQVGQEMGLSLGDRDLYLEEEAQELLDMYAEHVSKMFQLTGLLFTVRPHCPWLNIRFIVHIFTHNLLFVVANYYFCTCKTTCRQSRCKSKVCRRV